MNGYKTMVTMVTNALRVRTKKQWYASTQLIHISGNEYQRLMIMASITSRLPFPSPASQYDTSR